MEKKQREQREYQDESQEKRGRRRGDDEVTISQDIYESNTDFRVKVDIAEQIIRFFPTLSPNTIQVLSQAIMNKLTQGVIYSDEMEKMISTVIPRVMEGFAESPEKRRNESKRRILRSPTPEREYTKNPLEKDLQKHIDENHLLNLTYHIAKEMIKKYGEKEFYNTLQDEIQNKNISFPFIKYFENEPSFFFKNLMKREPKFSHPSNLPDYCSIRDKNLDTNKFIPFGKNTVLETESSDYRKMDLISDLFQEKVRLQAKRKDQKVSAMDHWLQMGSDLIEDLIYEKKDITPYELREMSHKNIKEATQFKPSLAVSVYQIFNVLKNERDNTDQKLRILDFSAGWGDRLIGAMAFKAKKYIAADPNMDLRKGHLEMIRTLYPIAFPGKKLPSSPDEFPEDFQVIYEPFQTASIPKDEKFDLIFTSPPYFDFEVYSEGKEHSQRQSIQQFPKFDDWMKGFLFKSLEKGWDLLEIGGYMVIHIKDMREIKVCEPMNLFIQGYLEGAKYLGVLGTRGSSNKILPMWVWEKEEKTNTKAQKQAKELFEKYYSQYTGKQVKQDIYRESGYQQQKLGNEDRKIERFSHLEKILPSGAKYQDVLLDIGAGNAELTDYFGRNLKAKTIYALDVYPESDFVQPTPDSNVIYKQIKDDHLPIPDHSVNIVMMMMLLHHVDQDKKKNILKEIKRVLKPGGLVFIREHDVQTGDKGMEKYLDDVHSKFNPNPMEHSVEKTYYMSRKELRDLFTKEGFTHLYDSNYKGKNPQAIYHELYWFNQ